VHDITYTDGGCSSATRFARGSRSLSDERIAAYVLHHFDYARLYDMAYLSRAVAI